MRGVENLLMQPMLYSGPNVIPLLYISHQSIIQLVSNEKKEKGVWVWVCCARYAPPTTACLPKCSGSTLPLPCATQLVHFSDLHNCLAVRADAGAIRQRRESLAREIRRVGAILCGSGLSAEDCCLSLRSCSCSSSIGDR